jgi:hypothetical protein
MIDTFVGCIFPLVGPWREIEDLIFTDDSAVEPGQASICRVLIDKNRRQTGNSAPRVESELQALFAVAARLIARGLDLRT